MDDIIPLLIIIAISVIGAIGRKKTKRENPKIVAPQNQQQDDGIFDWLEKITDEENEVEETVKFVSQPVQPESEKQFTPEGTNQVEQKLNKPNNYSAYSGFISQEEKEKLTNKEGINTVPKRESTIYKHNKQHRDTTQTPQKIKRKTLVRAFNLKQAVIYSEILNPKYKL